MRNKGIYAFILAMLLVCQLQAQSDPTLILVEGRALTAADSMPVPYAHIWGLKRNAGTITDSAGWFQIYAFADDTLIFSAVGLGQQRLAIPAEAARTHVTFWLNENSYDIDEVTILPFNKNDLRKDFMDLQLPPDKYAINLNLPKVPVSNKPPLSRPVSLLLGILTLDLYAILPEKIVFKERWEQKQVDKWTGNEQYLERIAEKYNPEYVKLIVPLTDEQVGPFVKFCALQNDFIADATEYEIGEAIKECYLAWVETQPKTNPTDTTDY